MIISQVVFSLRQDRHLKLGHKRQLQILENCDVQRFLVLVARVCLQGIQRHGSTKK